MIAELVIAASKPGMRIAGMLTSKYCNSFAMKLGVHHTDRGKMTENSLFRCSSGSVPAARDLANFDVGHQRSP